MLRGRSRPNTRSSSSSTTRPSQHRRFAARSSSSPHAASALNLDAREGSASSARTAREALLSARLPELAECVTLSAISGRRARTHRRLRHLPDRDSPWRDASFGARRPPSPSQGEKKLVVIASRADLRPHPLSLADYERARSEAPPPRVEFRTLWGAKLGQRVTGAPSAPRFK